MEISSSPDYLTLEEITDASDAIYDKLKSDCEILWKDSLTESLGEILQVSVFPAGIF